MAIVHSRPAGITSGLRGCHRGHSSALITDGARTARWQGSGTYSAGVPANPRPTAPLDAALIAQALGPGTPWRVRSIGTTGSTNTDLAAQYLAGTIEPGRALIAQEQTAGRGRLGRGWHAPYGSSQILSVVVRTDGVPLARRGWIGAILGLALVNAIGECCGIRPELKWPNDVVVGDRKCAGILAEVAGDAVVVGAGLNLDVRPEEFPAPPVGSTALAPVSLDTQMPAHGSLDRVALAAATLRIFAVLLDRFVVAGGDPDAARIRSAYRHACRTIGRTVRVELPDGTAVVGVGHDITVDGALVVRTDSLDGASSLRTFTAGDVVHLRPVDPTVPPGLPGPHRARDALGPR